MLLLRFFFFFFTGKKQNNTNSQTLHNFSSRTMIPELLFSN